MLRSLVLLVLASTAYGQGIKTPYVPPVFPPVPPVPPGPIVGVSGIGGSVRIGGFRIGGYSSFVTPYLYPSYGPLTYFGPGYGFGYGYAPPSVLLPAPTPVAPVPLPNLAPVGTVNKDIAEAQFTARLELIFPTPAEVWIDGKKVEGSESTDVSLTSPPLKVGATHSFHVRATWGAEGSKSQVERSVAVKAGERSRLTIVSGDPVK